MEDWKVGRANIFFHPSIQSSSDNCKTRVNCVFISTLHYPFSKIFHRFRQQIFAFFCCAKMLWTDDAIIVYFLKQSQYLWHVRLTRAEKYFFKLIASPLLVASVGKKDFITKIRDSFVKVILTSDVHAWAIRHTVVIAGDIC